MPERNDWLKIELKFFHHRKTYALTALCKKDHIEVWPRLILLWREAFTSFPDGDVSSLFLNPNLAGHVLELPPDEAAAFLQHCIECGKGFAKSGFIDQKKGGYFLHDWSTQGSGSMFSKRETSRYNTEKHRQSSQSRDSHKTDLSSSRDSHKLSEVKSSQGKLKDGPSAVATVPEKISSFELAKQICGIRSLLKKCANGLSDSSGRAAMRVVLSQNIHNIGDRAELVLPIIAEIQTMKEDEATKALESALNGKGE